MILHWPAATLGRNGLYGGRPDLAAAGGPSYEAASSGEYDVQGAAIRARYDANFVLNKSATF